jgi:hypothetical protein
MESTLAGWQSTLFSLTSAAATYCGIMKPEFSPPSWVGEPLDTTLGDGRELGERHRRRVERERERLPVEVPVGHELPLLDEDEWIVGGRVELDADGCFGVREQVATGAVHLWRAAERVGVLHLVAPAVRFEDRGAFEEPEDVCGGRLLPGERAQLVDLREEARAGPLQRLERESARDVGGVGKAARPDEGQRADPGHELGAVDEREPFLRAQLNRLEACALERLRARERPPVEHGGPLADKR